VSSDRLVPIIELDFSARRAQPVPVKLTAIKDLAATKAVSQAHSYTLLPR
jgi:hypothetical protein